MTAEQVELLCYLSGVVTLEAARVILMNVLGIIGKMLISSDSDVLEPVQVYNVLVMSSLLYALVDVC